MSVTLAVGSAVAKATLKVWLRDRDVAQDLSASLVDIITAKVPNVLERRKAQRSFERIADTIAERLDLYVESELGGIPANEREAAVLAVADSLNRTEISDAILFGANLDALELERLVRTMNEAVISGALLSPAAHAFFDRVLQEACAYVIEVATSMPSFSPHALTEMLRRETETQQMLELVIARLPAGGASASGTAGEFELRYRRELARELDRVELFGLTVSEFVRRYTLSVAYISLTASSKPRRRSDDREPKGNGKSAEAGDDDYVRVEEVLAQSLRTLLRGEAGSGKTTLLQWIAVRSARRDFDGELAIWNDTVPFFLQLRRYVGKQLPRPEDFLTNVTPNVVGVMPQGWVHDVLSLGRAIVLIDGVDELPEDERNSARQWLRQLAASFPSSRFIVTSRPAAIGATWLEEEEFSTSELQPMTLQDIAAFIEHWHDAVCEGGDANDRDDIISTGRRLVAVIRDNPQLRALATSPLLCAMLCALNRDRRAQLPRDRLELYRISLETLLERRDVERVVMSGGVELALPQKELLLRYFAYWLVVNGKTDSDRAAAITCISRSLQSLPDLSEAYEPETVYEYLLNRSGLLREAVVGRTDFIHRTFQEYLAAKEIVEQDSIGLLLEHAGSDSWRDVIILAVGHARVRERHELIEGLLAQGEAEPEMRHRLHLLAVACLETARQLSPELVLRLRGTLETLVPPTNMTEARALASAGELAVPLLRTFAGAGVNVAAASVRTLALIGTPAAMDALTAFAADSRVTVTRELVRAWSFFDPSDYAERVLSNSPLENRSITVRDVAVIPFVPGLRHAEAVNVRIPRRLSSLDVLLPIADRIVSLDASNSLALRDLSEIRSFRRLRQLNVANTGVASLEPLRDSALTRLIVDGCQGIDDLTALSQSPLEALYCRRTGVASVQPLIELSRLQAIDLGHTAVREVSALATLPLKIVRLTKTAVQEVPFTTGNLEVLYAEATQVLDLSGGNWRSLELLELGNCSQLRSVGALRGATNLASLDVSQCSSLTDLHEIADLPLVHLWMQGYASNDFGWLENVRHLQFLDLSGCSTFSDGSILAQLSQLRTLRVPGTGLKNFGFLGELPNLRSISIDSSAQAEKVRRSLQPGQRVQIRRYPASYPSALHWYQSDFPLYRLYAAPR